jgi:hypothetical protein
LIEDEEAAVPGADAVNEKVGAGPADAPNEKAGAEVGTATGADVVTQLTSRNIPFPVSAPRPPAENDMVA